MHFANDGIARDAVGEFRRNLAGAEPVQPQFAQKIHTFIGPGHD